MTTLHTRDRKRPAALLFIGIALLLAQPGGHAQITRPPLKLFKNYFLTGGDYQVGGVGLRGQGQPQPDPVTGVTVSLATGMITLANVPDTADISAAFLYWASLEPNDAEPMSADGFFRGRPIHGRMIGPASRVPGCWGSGGGGGSSSPSTQLRAYRADVLKDFPADPTGKLLVNGNFEVKLPDSGGGGTQSPSSGNQVRYVEGASLVIVYRVATSPTLRGVVIYDGAVTVDQDIRSMQLNVGGYYDATAAPNAQMTHVVADGDLRPEILTINEQQVGGSNPLSGLTGSAWDNPTFPVNNMDDDGISTGVSFSSPSIDCLSWAAVVARVDIEDGDGDGIPNKVEAGTAVPADGEPPLPDFVGMGADPGTPDLFVEFGFFKTSGWGAVGAHDHRPTAAALAMAGKAFKRAGITPHFDVGPDDLGDDRYPAPRNPSTGPCANAATWTLGCAIVSGTNARGGEFVTEAACTPTATQTCQFPNDAGRGTVGWKSGYQYYRDAPVKSDGTQHDAAGELACEASGDCRHRFDATRHDFFHYSLWAHALGLPKEPCLNPDGTPNLTCQQTNPDYHVPARSSGFGDVGGGDSLITLHAFGFNYNGSDTAQAGTFMHELGHNFERRHGGEVLERNCKPNYISVMSYLFQVHGMNGGTDVDFSGQELNPLDEKALSDVPLVTGTGASATYPTRWYAPLATSFIQSDLLVTPAAKHCDGSLIESTDVINNMIRVDGLTAGAAVDWLNDGVISSSVPSPGSDPNFDGDLTPLSADALPPNGRHMGSNDWSYIFAYGLRQMASRPNMGLTSLDMSVAEVGDPGRGDPGRGDPGRGDPGRGDPGRGDPGRGDPGRGDPGVTPDQGDLTLDNASAIFNGPTALKANKVGKTIELTWAAPQFMLPGVIVEWTTAYRVEGDAITTANWANRVDVGKVFYATTPQKIVDTKPLNNKRVTYIVVVDFLHGASVPAVRTRSGISNPVSIIY